ncbi:SIR2 family protein [Celeribacter naphthalenivorans]|uniref:SIR2 family protein n=1 Tax=Celeribacter naphthalenivorans TaxID=1614694 RepID=UPI001CFC41D4|nr:SIR2 family protein [Celeribacter naphthalenivorans]
MVTEVAERRVVIFVGAGISKAAHNDMPSWPSLLEEMGAKLPKKKDRELVKRLIRYERLLDAAELINSQVIPADRRALLEEKFKLAPVPEAALYSHILELDPKVCITTNYDQFIEKNFERFSGGMSSHQVRLYNFDGLISDLRSPARIILKIHGCITEPSNIVLDKKSYFNAKSQNPGVYEAVKALCTVNTVLFLGYSMGDPDIQLILEDINAKAKSDHRHFALVPKFEHPSLREANQHTYNVEFIEYPSGRHDLVPKALKELSEAVVATRASSGSRV